MSTSNGCSACEKGTGVYYCTGCEKYFCSKDFRNHRQKLTSKMDELVEDRNDLQEKLINNEIQCKTSPDSSLSQNNGWKKITDQFKETTEQIVQLRETDDYTEYDLERIKRIIHQLNEDLQQIIQSPTIELHTNYSDLIASDHIDSVKNKEQNPPKDVEEIPNQEEKSTITGVRTYKTNANSTAPMFIAFEWGLENLNKKDVYNGRAWSSQYQDKTYSWTVFYVGVPICGAVKVVGGRMQVSNISSTTPFLTLRSWGKKTDEEHIISDGYCWSEQYRESYQRTSFFLTAEDQEKDIANIIGGRMQITNEDSSKPWISINEWGQKSEYEVIISESRNWSTTYKNGYQRTSLFFDRNV